VARTAALQTRGIHQIGVSALIGLVSIVAGFLLVEAGYRLVLLGDPRMVMPWRLINPMTVGAIEVYDRSAWTFDRDEGYQYVRDDVHFTRIVQGTVTDCGTLNPVNANGGGGIIEGDYASADIKIAVFGDSFTWFSSPENLTWTNYLQRDLQRFTGRGVHVLNFARDGTGVMRMFDLAMTRLPKYRPDFAIFSFTTGAMGPGRIWRFEAVVDDEPRVFTVPTPDRTIDPSIAYDTAVLHPHATPQWCQSVKGSGDDLTREIVDKYVRLRGTRYSPLTPFRSFLWNKLVNKDPFSSPRAMDRISRSVSLQPFSGDTDFLKAVDTVEATNVPYLLLHVPYYPEVASGDEFLPGDRISQLARSDLEKVTRHRVIGLLENLETPVREPERMNYSSENLHPSSWGMKMIATGALRALIREKLIDSGH
jgi:hypothetical protein